ncbi:MAG: TraB/VirB10 family protein [Sulfurimonas sp.]|jgi:conjugal transfer pilus assembly protein TraB
MLDKFSSEKKKQFIYAGAVVAGLSATILLLSSAFQEDKPIGVIETPDINIMDKKDTDNKVFRKEFGDKDATQTAEIDKLKEELEAMKNGTGQPNATTANQQPTDAKQTLSSNLFMPPPPAPPSIDTAKMPPPPPVSDSKPEKPEPPKSIVMGDMIGMIAGPTATADPKDEMKKNSKKIEIPGGSFMGGVLLSGLDAPTGGKAKTGPQPVLIKITNLARLPNKFRANLKECHVIGSAYGDLSSERAFVRVEKLTCMTEDGRAIEKGATGQSFGYVTGEDGKVGLPGRVVSKQGAVLARTLAAGFLEGVSKAFTMSTSTVSIQPTGSMTTPDPSQTLNRGLFGGAGEASKKLADFYMKMANEMFPVVEISAGRKVDIILLEKLTFELDEKDEKVSK